MSLGLGYVVCGGKVVGGQRNETNEQYGAMNRVRGVRLVLPLIHFFSNSVRQVRDKPPNPGSQTIHGSRRRNVERAVVFVAPCQICRLFRHKNRPQMMPLRIPNPDPLWASHKKIASLVHLDSIGNTIVRLPLFLAENAAVKQASLLNFLPSYLSASTV